MRHFVKPDGDGWHRLVTYVGTRYSLNMTKLLEEAIGKVCRLPDSRQEDVAHLLLSIVEQHDVDAVRLTKKQVNEVRRRQADHRHATAEEVAAFFNHAGA